MCIRDRYDLLLQKFTPGAGAIGFAVYLDELDRLNAMPPVQHLSLIHISGAALAFLCFDFFFRFVKGVQPLTRCGVGGVQR